MDPLALAGAGSLRAAGAQVADGSSEGGAPYMEMTPSAGEYAVMTPSDTEDGGTAPVNSSGERRHGRGGRGHGGADGLPVADTGGHAQAALADAGGSRFGGGPGNGGARDASDLERESREVEVPYEDQGKVEGEANEVSPRYATETTALLVRDDMEGALSATAPLLYSRSRQSHSTDTRHVPPTRIKTGTGASGGGLEPGGHPKRSPAMGGAAGGHSSGRNF